VRWWENRPRERFWLEVTDREELGINLTDEMTHGFSLASSVHPDDIVFHWEIGKGIVGWSRVTAEAFENGGMWEISLADYQDLAMPVTLDKWQQFEDEVGRIQDDVVADFRQPHYLPFSSTKKPGSTWPMRPTAGAYLSKFPCRWHSYSRKLPRWPPLS
jgi:hypothetical protein